MLLPSHRHSAADLAAWEDYERIDLRHGMMLERSKKPGKSIAGLRAFVAAGPCYIGTSWGKDSVVALHLALRAGVDAPVYHVVQEGPHKDPYQSDVRDAFLARFDIDYREMVVEEQAEEQDEQGVTPALMLGVRRIQAALGTRRWISGIRADESRVRKIRARRGLSSTCWPIMWWSARDVYGYLAHHDLPVHPSYAMTRGGLEDRDQLRVSIIGGKKGRGFGRQQWERFYYDDVLHGIEGIK